MAAGETWVPEDDVTVWPSSSSPWLMPGESSPALGCEGLERLRLGGLKTPDTRRWNGRSVPDTSTLGLWLSYSKVLIVLFKVWFTVHTAFQLFSLPLVYCILSTNQPNTTQWQRQQGALVCCPRYVTDTHLDVHMMQNKTWFIRPDKLLILMCSL